MKNLLLSATLLLSMLGYGQQDQRESLKAITTTVTQSVEVHPSSFSVILSLSEKVNVNEETQVTNSITMGMILERLNEKMIPYGIDTSDLELYTISESTSPTLINGYNAYANYSAVKKKLLSRKYTIEWTKSILELESFLRSLRFNGFENAHIIPIYSDLSLTKAKEDLLIKALEVAKRNATIIATAAAVKLGDLQNIYETYYTTENYNYSNYNNGNYNGNITASISVSGINLVSRTRAITLTVSYAIKDS